MAQLLGHVSVTSFIKHFPSLLFFHSTVHTFITARTPCIVFVRYGKCYDKVHFPKLTTPTHISSHTVFFQCDRSLKLSTRIPLMTLQQVKTNQKTPKVCQLLPQLICIWLRSFPETNPYIFHSAPPPGGSGLQPCRMHPFHLPHGPKPLGSPSFSHRKPRKTHQPPGHAAAPDSGRGVVPGPAQQRPHRSITSLSMAEESTLTLPPVSFN